MKYLCDPHIIPTVVPLDVAHIVSTAVSSAEYASWLHVDIDDGKFVRPITWPFLNPGQKEEIGSLIGEHHIPETISLEAHLMIESPEELGEQLASAGFARIIAHIEAFKGAEDAVAALDRWRAAGAREVGVAIKIDTPLTALDGVAEHADVICVMSIAEIGSQGRSFDERALSRVEELHARYPDTIVAVDGGVSEATVEELVRAGANRLSVGHALAGSGNPAQTYARIYERAMRGCAPVNNEKESVNS